jgi:hypothetical protein
MFEVSKISAYPRVDQLNDASLGQAPALLANIRQGWKGRPGSNTPAFLCTLEIS